MPCAIYKKDGKTIFTGSTLYSNSFTDSLEIQFFTTVKEDSDKTEQDSLTNQLFQDSQPTPQTFIVEYPLLAYKDCVPTDNQIGIMHLA